jgi:hypothetical protein
MPDCHVCTDGNAGMFGDWLADDVGPEWDDTDYNAMGDARRADARNQQDGLSPSHPPTY